MQDLQRDLAAFLVYGVGHDAVTACGAMRGQAPGKRLGPPGNVGRKAARDDQANITARAFGKVGGQAVEVVAVFQPGVHRAHQHAVLERGEAEIKRGKQARVRRGGRGGGHVRRIT